jgi:hypothetical protein
VAEKFSDEREEQSQIKAEIFSKYFWSWAKVIIGAQKKYGATASPTLFGYLTPLSQLEEMLLKDFAGTLSPEATMQFP